MTLLIPLLLIQLTIILLLIAYIRTSINAQKTDTKNRHTELLNAISRIRHLPLPQKPEIKKPKPHTPPKKQSPIPGTPTENIRYSTIPCPSCDYIHMVNMNGNQKRFICPTCQQPIEIE